MKFWKQKYYSLFVFLVLIVINIFIYFSFAFSSEKIGRAYFLDVGQGDATLFKTPSGLLFLIDTGPDRTAVIKALSQVLPIGIRKIDAVLITHFDSDHIGGLPALLNNFEVGYIFLVSSSADKETAITREVRKIAQDKNIQVISPRAGQLLDFGGATFQILSPGNDLKNIKDNESSVVGRLVENGKSFLLTGDAPQDIEQYLVKMYGSNLKTDVLKVGHHGSKTSSAVDFLANVKPDYSIVSAGLNNRYGHPHQEVLDLLGKIGTKLEETFKQGTIIFDLNTDDLVLEGK